jgi:hypothetical protein
MKEWEPNPERPFSLSGYKVAGPDNTMA